MRKKGTKETVLWYVFYCLFTRKCFINVLTNCNGENGFNGWILVDPTFAEFRIEDVASTDIPEIREIERCVATSRNFCIKFQNINLEHDSLFLKVVRLVHPRILLTDWVTARFDAAVLYCSRITLFEDNETWLYQNTVEHKVEQLGNSWVKLERVIKDYPISFKAIRFGHIVQKNGIYDGDSGIKITGTVMKFDFECINLILDK